jgi:hypothetical protein
VRGTFATFAEAATYRAPYKMDDTLTLENYDTTDYGYLRVIVNATTMRIEFHPQHDGVRPRLRMTW